MTRIGVDVRPERVQNVHGIFGVVHRAPDFRLAEVQLFTNAWKFPGKIVVPVDSTSAISREIRFAHRSVAPTDRCTGSSAGASIPFPLSLNELREGAALFIRC